MNIHKEIVALDQPVYQLPLPKEGTYEKDIIVNGEKFSFTVINDVCHYNVSNKIRDLTDYYEDMVVELVRGGVKLVRFLYVTGVPTNGYISIVDAPINVDNFERSLFLDGALAVVTELHTTRIYKYTGLNDKSMKTYMACSKEELKSLLSQYLRLGIPTSIPEDLLVIEGSKMVGLRSAVLRSSWMSTLSELRDEK